MRSSLARLFLIKIGYALTDLLVRFLVQIVFLINWTQDHTIITAYLRELKKRESIFEKKTHFEKS